MEAYFVPKADKFLGRSMTTLPTVINKDLGRLPASDLKIKTKKELDHLRSITLTEDRTPQSRLSANIREAAKASKSEH